MLHLERHCDGILTDSGGVQKEAYFFTKPCITLRDETEWVELVEHGYNQLTGADKDRILVAVRLDRQMDFNENLYGDGTAGRKIVRYLMSL